MTQVEETRAAGPDLSGLDDALRRRIDVAVARGARWKRLARRWALGDGELRFAVWYDVDATPIVSAHLPDPENDPAAAWELATAERICLSPSPRDRATWWASPVLDDDASFDEAIRRTVHAGSPGRAVVDAFLAKHRQGRDIG